MTFKKTRRVVLNLTVTYTMLEKFSKQREGIDNTCTNENTLAYFWSWLSFCFNCMIPSSNSTSFACSWIHNIQTLIRKLGYVMPWRASTQNGLLKGSKNGKTTAVITVATPWEWDDFIEKVRIDDNKTNKIIWVSAVWRPIVVRKKT